MQIVKKEKRMAKNPTEEKGYVKELICYSCEHFLGYSKEFKRAVCWAFLEGIPKVIIDGKNDHEEKLRGQEGDYVYRQIL